MELIGLYKTDNLYRMVLNYLLRLLQYIFKVRQQGVYTLETLPHLYYWIVLDKDINLSYYCDLSHLHYSSLTTSQIQSLSVKII